MHTAARANDLHAAQQSIDEHADVNARDRAGLTALHLAQTPELTEFLIANGAEVDATSDNRDTPLHLQTLHRRREVVEVLLRSGADANALNMSLETPLDRALAEAARTDDETLQILHQAGGRRGPMLAFLQRDPATFEQLESDPQESAVETGPWLAPNRQYHPERWCAMRRFVEAWTPHVEWRCSISEATLNDVEAKSGVKLPRAYRDFCRSGLYDWLFSEGLGIASSIPSKWKVNRIWSRPELLVHRANESVVPVMQLDSLSVFGIDWRDLPRDDPQIGEYQSAWLMRLNPPPTRLAARSLTEFVTLQVFWAAMEHAPASRQYHSDPPDRELRRAIKTSLSPLPFTTFEFGSEMIAFEGRDLLYLEEWNPYQNIKLAATLVSKSPDLLNELCGREDDTSEQSPVS